MRKIIALLVLSLFVVSNVFAVDFMSTDTRKVLSSTTIVNPFAASTVGSNLGTLITAVSTSTIVPGFNRIIGYEVSIMDTGKTSVETWVTLADTTSALFKATAADAAPTGQFAESEAQSGLSLYRIFPYPKNIDTQLVVYQSPNTVVTIYYDVR